MKISAHAFKTFLVLSLFAFVLTGCLFHYIDTGRKEIEHGIPRYFQADYGMVWDATIDTVDAMGYTIAVMRKEEGYIATQMNKSSWYWRDKLSIRLHRENNAVKVNVSIYAEKLLGYDGKNPYWVETTTSGNSEQWIIDKIAKRLLHGNK